MRRTASRPTSGCIFCTKSGNDQAIEAIQFGRRPPEGSCCGVSHGDLSLYKCIQVQHCHFYMHLRHTMHFLGRFQSLGAWLIGFRSVDLS